MIKDGCHGSQTKIYIEVTFYSPTGYPRHYRGFSWILDMNECIEDNTISQHSPGTSFIRLLELQDQNKNLLIVFDRFRLNELWKLQKLKSSDNMFRTFKPGWMFEGLIAFSCPKKSPQSKLLIHILQSEVLTLTSYNQMLWVARYKQKEGHFQCRLNYSANSAKLA